MRMCSLSNKVQGAQNKKATENNIHWLSSAAFDARSIVKRVNAFVAEIITDKSMHQADAFPIKVFILSMKMLNASIVSPSVWPLKALG